MTEAVAANSVNVPSLVGAVGSALVDAVPPGLAGRAVGVLGPLGKPLVAAGVLAVGIASGVVLGRVAARRFWLAPVTFAVVGLLGAATASPAGTWVALPAAASAAVATLFGTLVLRVLLAGPPAEHDLRRTDSSTRRTLLARGMRVAVLATLGLSGFGLARRLLTAAGEGAPLPPLPPLPAPQSPPPPPPAAPRVAGLSPLLTPNGDFYRIDTRLTVPQVDPEGWRLRVTGMVEEPFELTYEQLLPMATTVADVTLACVSNEVGGSLVGTARWQGVDLRALLERARPRRGAAQIVGRSVDGFTAGFPLETLLDGRRALVAVGMNGEPLPRPHGFPARLVVPGLYGYVSATKWLTELELTTWDGFDAYWIVRGWAKKGPVKLQSRIDVPRPGAVLASGRQPIAGVAWAPTRGVDAVQVRIDDGDWQAARLAGELHVDTWRQWVLDWDAPPGRHELSVRAVDGDGRTQTERRSRPHPDGATGHHTIEVHVSERDVSTPATGAP